MSIYLVAAAAAAKSLQSCPTLCNPIDGSPLGSSVSGILQARTLEWVAISFSNAWLDTSQSPTIDPSLLNLVACSLCPCAHLALVKLGQPFNKLFLIGPGCSLEGMMLKPKLQYFGHLMQRVISLEKTLMLGGIGGRRRRG